MSESDLSKYNIAVRPQSKVTKNSVSASSASEVVLHGKDGRTMSARRASSTTVKEVASKVIQDHRDVIRRPAKR